MKPLNILASVMSATFFTVSATAHDAWIELDQTKAEHSEWEAKFFVGHAEDRNAYALDAARVASFNSVTQSGHTSHIRLMKSFSLGDTAEIALAGEGSGLVTLSTFRAVSELDAEKFNDYVKEDGIRPILIDRAKKGLTEKPGIEVYSRFLKGLAIAPDDGCDLSVIGQPVGQILEIIPITHPGKGCEGDLEFELQYFGEPVAGATLHFNRTDETLEPIKADTNENGRAGFERPDDGIWYVHAAWAIPVSRDRFDADYATSFASVSFSLD